MLPTVTLLIVLFLHYVILNRCFHPREEAVNQYVTSLLAPYLSLSTSGKPISHTLIIFNYGLHIHQSHSWMIKPMLLALLQAARDVAIRQLPIKIVFRETSSQSFTGSAGGYFRYDLPGSPSSFCCSRPAGVGANAKAWDAYMKTNTTSKSGIGIRDISSNSYNQSTHALPALQRFEWRNRLVLDVLQTLDLHWSSLIGWLPFFRTSAMLWDLRAEWNQATELPDCTHFVYSPIAFRGFWNEVHHILQA